MTKSFPNESHDYRAARNRLLEQEIALRRQMEAVAEARRALPPDGQIPEDYAFVGLGADGRPTQIRLSELFRPGTDALVIYCYMFPRHCGDGREKPRTGETARLPKAEGPCPSCTALIDQLDGAAEHFEAGGGNFAVVADAPLDRLLGVARDRGWRRLRLLSSTGTSFKRDYHSLDDDGQQMPLTLVFQRDSEGAIRLFWASEMFYAPSEPGQDPRAAGTLEPLWNMFDLVPGGRPAFDEQMQYDLAPAVPARIGDCPDPASGQAG